MAEIESQEENVNIENSDDSEKNQTECILKKKCGEWKQHFAGYLDWPPAKWGRGRNETLAKEGKSPIEIWEVHSTDILENHKHLKQFHENILTEYEKSKEQGQTMQFWKQYWKDTYSTNLPNPFDMEDRWNAFVKNGNSKDKFWDDERKKFKKENGWSFWKNRAFCENRFRHNPNESEQRCFKRRMINNLIRKKIENPEGRALFQMFDF